MSGFVYRTGLLEWHDNNFYFFYSIIEFPSAHRNYIMDNIVATKRMKITKKSTDILTFVFSTVQLLIIIIHPFFVDDAKIK